MPTQVIPLEGIDKIGLIKDAPSSTLPPGAWTDARNVRFDDGAIRRMKGQVDLFAAHGFTDIQHITYWENPNVRCYVVIERESTGDVPYLVTISGDGEAITSQKGGPYTRSENWTSTDFNGGYSIIINNGIDAPKHITVQLGGASNISSIADFEDLPGWDSYLSGSYVSEYLSVSADILISYGNLLVAGSLTERSSPQLSRITGITRSGGGLSVVFDSALSLVVGDEFSIVNDPNYTFTYTATGDGTLIDQDEDRTVIAASLYNGIYEVTSVSITGSVTTLGCERPGDPTFFNAYTDSTLALPDQPKTDAAPDVSNLLPPFSGSGDITSYWLMDGGDPTPTEIVRDLTGVVRTSSVAAPGAIPQNWNPFDTAPGTADELSLANAGRITAIRELRGNLFCYTSDTITQLRVSASGLTSVPITREYGALTQSGVFEFQGTHLIVGSDDIYIFAGNPGDIKSVADGRVRRYFYDNLHSTTFRNLQIVRNQIHDEIWLCYPTVDGNGTLDEALVWSYTGNTWTTRDLPNVRAVSLGPIEGASTTGTFYDVAGWTGYELTVTNANGQSTVQGLTAQTNIVFADFLTAINTDINGQAGLTSRVEGTGLVVDDARLTATPWTFNLRVLNVFGGFEDVVGVPYEPDGSVDSERPWPQSILNESKNYVIMAGTNRIQAGEVGYLGFLTAGVARTNLHFAPSRETESLRAVYMNTEGTNTNLTVGINITDTPAGERTTAVTDYTFNTSADYKIDVRHTSRLIDIEIEESEQQPIDESTMVERAIDGWLVADLALEIGRGGTR